MQNQKTYSDYFQLIVSALGLFGVALLQNMDWWIRLAIAMLIFFIILWSILKESPRIRLISGERKFVKYFSEWYTQSGKLSVFCHDLTWVSGTPDDPIRKALVTKAANKELTLYLKEMGKLSEELKQHKGKVVQIPSYIKSDRVFSILENGDFAKIIIRNKFLDSSNSNSRERIEFISTSLVSEPYIVFLAKDILQACENHKT